MTDAAADPRTDLKDTLEEMRASVAARSARGGLAGAIQAAILGLFEVLMTLLQDFRAGKLVPPAPSPRDAVAAPCVAGSDRAAGGKAPAPPPARSGLWGWWRRKDGAAQDEDWGDCRAVAPSLPRPWPTSWPEATAGEGEDIPTPALPRSAGLGREADRRANGTGGANGGGDRAVAPPPPWPSPLEGEGEEAGPRFPARSAAMADGSVADCVDSGAQWIPTCTGMTGAREPAAFAAVAGYARHSPGFPALQAVKPSDSKNWVLDERDSADVIVPA